MSLDIKTLAIQYLTITNELGPSEQLLAFINQDGSLGAEIGLESFDSFSLNTKHELLASKLKIIAESTDEVIEEEIAEVDGDPIYEENEEVVFENMAKRYVEITKEMGPSEQLLRFVNYDKKLGKEIGLEGFEDFSYTTQHEILLSKLAPEKAAE